MQIVINVDRAALRQILWGFALLVVLVVPVYLFAGQVNVPHEFVPGDLADADKVNANFDALATGINENDLRVSELVSAITVSAGKVGIGTTRPV